MPMRYVGGYLCPSVRLFSVAGIMFYSVFTVVIIVIIDAGIANYCIAFNEK